MTKLLVCYQATYTKDGVQFIKKGHRFCQVSNVTEEVLCMVLNRLEQMDNAELRVEKLDGIILTCVVRLDG